jgi:hypothetical protein
MAVRSVDGMLSSTSFAVAIGGPFFGLSPIVTVNVPGATSLFVSVALVVRRARRPGALASSPNAAATWT